MALLHDIPMAYPHPRRIMARKLAGGVREDRAFAYLLGACGVFFVAQWPRLARQADLDATISLEARLGGALMGWLVLAPLAMYGLAAVVHILTRPFRGQGSWFTSRLALFWSFLALSPLVLAHGIVAGVIGPSGAGQTALAAAVATSFVWLWGSAMVEAEKGPHHHG